MQNEIGEAYVQYARSGSFKKNIFQEVGTPEDLRLTVTRSIAKKTASKIFGYSVAVLISFAYINMGCALDLDVMKSVLKRPIGKIIKYKLKIFFHKNVNSTDYEIFGKSLVTDIKYRIRNFYFLLMSVRLLLLIRIRRTQESQVTTFFYQDQGLGLWLNSCSCHCVLLRWPMCSLVICLKWDSVSSLQVLKHFVAGQC